MLRKFMAGLATACLGLVVVAGPAAAATGTETFRVVFNGDPGNPVARVVASGVVNGVGTDKATDQPPGADLITLPGGTITIVTTTPPGGVTFDPRSCVVRINFTNGTYTVVGGTGAFQGASGSGTYSARAAGVLKRTNGTCAPDTRSFVATFTLTGPLTIP